MTAGRSRHGETRARLERSMVATQLAARGGALVVAVLTARIDARTVRRRWVPMAATAAFILEGGWVSRRFVQRASLQDENSAALDLGASLCALVAEAFAHGHRHRPLGPRFGIDYAAGSLTFASSETAKPQHLAAGALAISATYFVAVSAPATARVNDLAIMTSGVALQPILAQQRRLADHADTAREDALAQAGALAIEQERQRQRRLLHDSALQVLEAIAGGWDIDDELLFEAIELETARLKHAIHAIGPSRNGTFVEGLERMVTLLRRDGVEVHLQLDELDELGLSEALVAALCDATLEALTNVQKHSNARHVSVGIDARDRLVIVLIEDDGCGFDVVSQRRGFGIKESIEGRMTDIGGAARIDSHPGGGTRVVLEAQW